MRRVLVVATMAVAAAVGLVGLADATQNRPDPLIAGGNEVLLSVRTRAGMDTDSAAATLWATCQHTVLGSRLVALSSEGGGRYRFELAPAVGEHGQRRLVGCLEDATVERILAQVESFGPARSACASLPSPSKLKLC